jgi:hypothetical protein
MLIMDFMKAISFPFDDEEWLKKLGLGVLIQFIPIVGGFALQGWSFELAKRVKNNDPVPLPDWSDFGEKLGKGFMLTLAGLIYQLPAVIFYCVMILVFLLPLMGAEDEDLMATLTGVAAAIAACCCCVMFIYIIVAELVYLAGYTRYIDTEEFGTFMQFGDNFALMRENIGDFAMLIVYFLLAGLIAGASIIIFGLGLLVGTPFLMYFTGHLMGQLSLKLVGGGIATAPQV